MPLIVLIILLINVFVAYTLWNGIARIPRKHRTVEPYIAWLTLVPFAGVVFLWVLLPYKIPESLKSYFSEQPNMSEDLDYGRQCGLWAMGSYTTMLVFFWIIPLWFLGMIVAVVSLILLVQYISQFRGFVDNLPTVLNEVHGMSSEKPKDSNKYRDLSELQKLLTSGALSQEEFDAEKKKILDRDD